MKPKLENPQLERILAEPSFATFVEMAEKGEFGAATKANMAQLLAPSKEWLSTAYSLLHKSHLAGQKQQSTAISFILREIITIEENASDYDKELVESYARATDSYLSGTHPANWSMEDIPEFPSEISQDSPAYQAHLLRAIVLPSLLQYVTQQ